MTCWLDYQSPYFHSINLTDSDSETVSTLIDSAIAFVERVCNRRFALQGHDSVFTVSQEGAIVLDNPPIVSINRLCVAADGWVAIRNTLDSVTNASYSTTDSALCLTHYADGDRVNTTLPYATYKTLVALATAITALGHGWTATASSGREGFPSVDIIAAQFGNAKGGNTLSVWDDFTGAYDDMDTHSGILQGYFVPGTKVRAVWSGGFFDVPEPIKQATANLVISAFAGAEGRIKSESLGGYSYTLEDVDKLPMSDKKVLAFYRDRSV